MPKIDLQMSARWLMAGWLAAIALFGLAPTIDLDVAHLFWRPEIGFAVVGNPLWEWLRQRLWDASILLFLFAGFAMLRSVLTGRRVAGMTGTSWGFLFTLYLAVPGVIVNGWLKMHSGRARPAEVTEFGGTHLFTPAGRFADQCSANCSFVSGEVSAAVVLGLALWLIAAEWSRLERWQSLYLRAAGLFIPGFIALQRVVTGRHFASDTIFAALITLSLGWIFYVVFNGQAAEALQRRLSRPARE